MTDPKPRRPDPKRPPVKRPQDPEGTRRNIIEVARAEFALNGLTGARIDEIAEKTKTSKRMIYYYFGDKEGLYLAALEDAYQSVRDGEAKLDIAGLSPIAGLAKLMEFTFAYHDINPSFIRMVMIENVHHARYVTQSSVVRNLNMTAIAHVKNLYDRGVEQGLFRPGLDPVDIHWQISALCVFNVANRPTFSHLFRVDLGTDERQSQLRSSAVEMVLRYVATPAALAEFYARPEA